MSADDQHAGASDPVFAALAVALAEPLSAGSLEAALHAARTLHFKHRADVDVGRIVEALELLMAQVWLGGDSDSGSEGGYARAATALGSADLASAEAIYAAIAGETAEPQAERLRDETHLVLEAARGARPPRAEVDETAGFDDTTRTAAAGELPLAAFAIDDETRPVSAAAIEAAAAEAETTRIVPEGALPLDALRGGPPAPGPEVTRVAAAGELPLEELGRMVAADEQLDELLGEIEGSAPQPAAPRGGPAVPPAPIFGDSADDDPHAPLDSVEVSLPEPRRPLSEAPEPGEAGEVGVRVGPDYSDQSWSGVRAFERATPTFEPGVESVDADTWDDPTQLGSTPSPFEAERARAEALVREGQLSEALGVYQDLAAGRPEDEALWERVGEIARMLQRRSEPPPHS